jgi:hypothetical protein
MDVTELVGCFVVEVGLRQAWPFIGFCDNRPTPAVERRLYIDADAEVSPASAGSAFETEESLVQAMMALNGLTVETAAVDATHALRLSFNDGHALLVHGEARPDTTGDVWWFGDQ